MTIPEVDTELPDGPFDSIAPPVSRTVEIDGIPMSALLSTAPEPLAVIVALHGGATTSAYFDCPGHPNLSLLRLASAAGFTVLALDRPGYGASVSRAAELTDPEHIVDLIFAAMDKHLDGLPRGAGVFLLAHSAGCPHAVRVAADPRGADLLGLELAGTGREHHAAAAKVLGAGRADPDAVRELLWQPAWLYPLELLGGAPIASSTPAYEATVLRRWSDRDFPELAARVRIPVNYSVGAYENVWRNDPKALAEVTALFTAAPLATAELLPAHGHNLSLGYSATTYHTRVVSFVKHCITSRNQA
ncbi:alpha/beta hydrolase [Nocardia sp. NBC_01730]|uniref:alpha/beta hydrolase n=1 Tax=Nocardia sp. NBC_01730 TaxID=2975998 RepID=UPI002E10AB8B|nr:alpha/beta hydrolase [Nocardia sp. NBC_01730]